MAQFLASIRKSGRSGGKSVEADAMMKWNQEPIPYQVALEIGWNLPIDVVGAGVYGGIVKRDENGRVIIGDEWPENNLSPPAHNARHSTGPYLDFSKLTFSNRGYSKVACIIQKCRGQTATEYIGLKPIDAESVGMQEKAATELELLFQQVPESERSKLANLVMTGGARPLHMCGMGRGGDTSQLIKVLIKYGADVNAKDNYEFTPLDRMSSNFVSGTRILRAHGGVNGRALPRGVPQWDSDEFAYIGFGNSDQ